MEVADKLKQGTLLLTTLGNIVNIEACYFICSHIVGIIANNGSMGSEAALKVSYFSLISVRFEALIPP